MRHLGIRIGERPDDLYIALAYTAASGLILAALGGNALGVLLVLVFPGYLLVAAIFPGNNRIDWTARIALSLGFSVSVVPLLALVLEVSPLGIRFLPLVIGITLFTILVGLVAHWRRMNLAPGDRLRLNLVLQIPVWTHDSTLDRALVIALAASIITAAGTLVYVIAAPQPKERFSEFYILGPGGNVSGYPTLLNVSQPGMLVLGISNHEAAGVSYSVRVDLIGLQIVSNATTGSSQTIEVNRTTWSMFAVTLADGQTWTLPYTIRIDSPSLWKVQFLLFKNGDFSSVYRLLNLYVTVR